MNRIRDITVWALQFWPDAQKCAWFLEKDRCILCYPKIYVKRPHKPAEKLFLLHVVRFVDNSAEWCTSSVSRWWWTTRRIKSDCSKPEIWRSIKYNVDPCPNIFLFWSVPQGVRPGCTHLPFSGLSRQYNQYWRDHWRSKHQTINKVLCLPESM
jgi:hypothetical protein